MPADLHINDEWKDILAAAGLDNFDALMQHSSGECVSWHTRGQTYRIDLPGGETIFLKRDIYTSVKDIFTDLWHLRRPRPACMNELWATRRVAELGIPAPEVIAWGQRRRASLPWRAAILMRELPGLPMHEFLKAEQSEARRRDVMQAAGTVAARLYEAGLSWPDMSPKHFIISDEAVGILDLARMRPVRLPRKCYVPKQVRRFCIALHDRGGSDDARANFLKALGR